MPRWTRSAASAQAAMTALDAITGFSRKHPDFENDAQLMTARIALLGTTA